MVGDWSMGWSAVGGIGSFVGGIGSFATLIVGLCTYRKELRRASEDRRNAHFEKLLEGLVENEVREAISGSDSPDESNAFFSRLDAKDEALRLKTRQAIDGLLLKIERILYLREREMLTGDGFVPFEREIRAVLSDANIQGYLKGDDAEEARGDTGKPRYHFIRMYMKCTGMEPVESEECKMSDDGTAVTGIQYTAESSCGGGNEIRSEDFDCPTMIIRINRLYREGMNDDQVYETVRGSWRVRPENADKYKVVLAVAFGTVKGAYLADHWEPSTKPGGQGRYAFVRRRDAAEEKRLARFVGKDVSGLFPKGAANPIRYFDVASEGRKDER